MKVFSIIVLLVVLLSCSFAIHLPIAGRPNDLTHEFGEHIPIHNFINIQYSINASVGTPGKAFRFVADTNISTTWVPGVGCAACRTHPRYDSSQSSTHVIDGHIYNASDSRGHVEGSYHKDIFTLGSISVPFKFVYAQHVNIDSSYAWNRCNYDGVIGLGQQSDTEPGYPTFFTALLDAGVITEPVFAFYITNKSGTDGVLSLGEIDKSKYTGNISYHPVTKPKLWSVNLASVIIDGHSIRTKAWDAVIDTGRALMSAPVADLASIAQYVGAYQSPLSEYTYTIDCQRAGKPNIIFNLGDEGTPYVMEPNDYIVGQENSGDGDQEMCFLGINAQHFAPGEEQYYVLGSMFVAKYYTVFDHKQQRIGFAQAKHK